MAAARAWPRAAAQEPLARAQGARGDRWQATAGPFLAPTPPDPTISPTALANHPADRRTAASARPALSQAARQAAGWATMSQDAKRVVKKAGNMGAWSAGGWDTRGARRSSDWTARGPSGWDRVCDRRFQMDPNATHPPHPTAGRRAADGEAASMASLASVERSRVHRSLARPALFGWQVGVALAPEERIART